MAFRETSVEDIEYVAESLLLCSKKLTAVAGEMRQEKRLVIHTQLDAVKNTYLRAIDKLASDIERHYRNEKRCDKTGEEPEWRKSQRKSHANKARLEARTKADELQITQSSQAKVVQTKAVKKTPKKQAKKKGA